MHRCHSCHCCAAAYAGVPCSITAAALLLSLLPAGLPLPADAVQLTVATVLVDVPASAVPVDATVLIDVFASAVPIDAIVIIDALVFAVPIDVLRPCFAVPALPSSRRAVLLRRLACGGYQQSSWENEFTDGF